MTTDQVDTRRVLSTALVTAVDHVGIAVPDLDAAIAWYHDHLGMIVLHEEVNDEQGIREAMLSVRGAAVGSAQVQLMAPEVPRQAWSRHPAAGVSGQRPGRPQ
jgi:methylmalonyl-CoA/ethylmalonyl-CoA epimerase